MQFYPSGQQPPWDAEIVARQSWRVAMVAVFVYAVLCGVPAMLWYFESISDTWAIGIAVLLASLFPLVGRSFSSTLRASNWTLAVSTDGLWLNLRSYLNHGFESADTVLHLRFDEIASAARHIVQRRSETSDGTLRWTEQSLELQLENPDTEQLQAAIAQERARRRTRKLLGGLITVHGRSHHVPVTVPAAGLIRVNWKSRYDFVRPDLETMLQRLASHIQRHEDQRQSVNDDWDVLPQEQVETRVLQLVETGDLLAATQLLESRGGYTLTDAKRFVDKLTAHLAS